MPSTFLSAIERELIQMTTDTFSKAAIESADSNHAHPTGYRIAATALFIVALYFMILIADWTATLLVNGPLTRHMLMHIFLMNVLAPLAALGIATANFMPRANFSALTAATILQLVLLWAWHAPPMLTASLDNWLVHLAASSTLFFASLLFWLSIFTICGARRWQAIGALLITGKLFCLLGALLIFAPRMLFACPATSLCGPGTPPSLADQQMAGILMVVACPLTYVTAGVIIAARWLVELSEREPAGIPQCREVRA